MIEVGERLQERYNIIEEIGSGRTSIIYRAEDTQNGRVVAVKSLRREVMTANPDGTMRFLREGRTLQQIDHPDIINVYDTIDEPHGGSYIIMDYLPGGTLEYKLTTEGARPIPEALDIAVKMSNAIAFIHDKKIIHRDISPMNIMFDAEGNPLLMDFNVARMGHMSPLTLKGALLGTVAYMAPEVILATGKVGPRSDIWSLGMTVYKMIAGEHPFALEAMKDVLVMTSTPAPPITDFEPDAPTDLSTMLSEMLTIAPEQRPSDMSVIHDKFKAIRSSL
ncbi:MAG: serine/threonine-protein kinase [Chloroflexota bacterium]